jgi:hypothetical protein
MVSYPADYRWSSYGEVMGGGAKGNGKEARAGLIRAILAHEGFCGGRERHTGEPPVLLFAAGRRRECCGAHGIFGRDSRGERLEAGHRSWGQWLEKGNCDCGVSFASHWHTGEPPNATKI